MKKWTGAIFLFCLPLLPIPLKSETNKSTGDIQVQVNGIVVESGVLRVSLFDSKEGFPSKKEKAARRHIEKSNKESLTVTFTDVPFGIYAVSALHDRNDNGRLDKNFLGIPKEPIAVSNNVKIRFGPPKFKKAQFTLNSKEKSLVINLPCKKPSLKNPGHDD